MPKFKLLFSREQVFSIVVEAESEEAAWDVGYAIAQEQAVHKLEVEHYGELEDPFEVTQEAEESTDLVHDVLVAALERGHVHFHAVETRYGQRIRFTKSYGSWAAAIIDLTEVHSMSDEEAARLTAHGHVDIEEGRDTTSIEVVGCYTEH